MIPPSILAAAIMATPAPAAQPAFPGLAALQDALNDLEKCRGLTGPECPGPQRSYKVNGAKCRVIPPEDGRPAIACRVDETLTYADPSQETTRDRDLCVRFARSGGPGIAPRWTVLQVRDRPCEMPSALKRDPNRVPERGQIESALVGAFTCYPLDGDSHCSSQPDRASVEAFRCRPVSPGAEAQARADCRVTGEVTGFRGRPMARLRNRCIHLERTTPAQRSPAYWIVAYVPDKVRCGMR